MGSRRLYVGCTPAIVGAGGSDDRGAAGVYLLEAGPPTDPPPLVAGGPDLGSPSYLAAASSLVEGAAAKARLYVASSAGRPGPDGRRGFGRLSAWAVDEETGALASLGATDSPGAGASHIALSRTGRYLLSANYDLGSISSHAVLPDGRLGPLASQVVQHGSGPVAGRQEAAHPHMVAVDPRTGRVLVPDLGADRVFSYELDEETGVFTALPEATIVLPPGSGPRHLAFLPDRAAAVLVNELASTVALLTSAGEDGYAVSDLVPAVSDRGVVNAPSAVGASADGALVYVANRGANTIAVFRPEGPRLERLVEAGCGGDWPRDLLVDEGGRRVLVANHRSHCVTAVGLDERGLPREPVASWAVACPNALALVGP